jgi:BspA type Leucine rich repeat region (6 copies)
MKFKWKLLWNRLLGVMLLLPVVVQAQFLFTTNNGAITITGYTASDATVVIPDTTNGYPVMTIGDFAVDSNTNLASITISTNVTSIGVESFHACTNLVSVTIPNSVTNIGAGAFAGCLDLTNITIPGSVTFIDLAAFYYCVNLNGVYFQGNAPDLGSDPYGSGLEVFSGVPNATIFFLPGTTGWDSTFGDLPTWSAYYTTNNGTISIAKYAGFGGTVSIPGQIYGFPVTSIGTNAFSYINSVGNITIPGSVTDIMDGAFYHCTNLTAFYFQGSPPTVGAEVFDGITNAAIYFLPQFTGWGSTFDGLPAWPLYPFYYTINNGAVIIDGYTGSGGEVVIPSTIKGMPVNDIADYAFEYCYSLTSIIIPSSVTNLGSYTFRYDSGLTNVVIPDSITKLNSSVFQGCDLTDIKLPDSLTDIGDLAFAFCPLTHITIPDGVTNIGDYAFEHTYLTTITLPKGLINFGWDEFYSCTNLKAAYFQGNAPSVGSLVFWGETGPPIYYLPATIGWGSTFGGLPTVPWLPQTEMAETASGSETNQFGFNINWASGQTVVVEACTNFSSPIWQPVQTNILTTGSAYFSDPQRTNFPNRFYRLRTPN